jgi:tRNA(Ile)-lysidine synthetase-like protein
LAQVDLATQRGTLRQALLALGIDLRTVGLEGIDTLLDHMHDSTRASIPSGPHPLIAGWAWTILCHSQVERNDKLQLSIHRAGALPVEIDHPHLGAPLLRALAIPVQGALTLDRWQLSSSLLTPDELPADWRSRALPWRFFGDAAQCGELFLATFRPGMSIAPLGMDGHQRALGDIFTDHKIAPFVRPGWPVVVTQHNQVVWLCGMIVSEAVRVQPTTRQVRHLLWQPLDSESIP